MSGAKPEKHTQCFRLINGILIGPNFGSLGMFRMNPTVFVKSIIVGSLKRKDADAGLIDNTNLLSSIEPNRGAILRLQCGHKHIYVVIAQSNAAFMRIPKTGIWTQPKKMTPDYFFFTNHDTLSKEKKQSYLLQISSNELFVNATPWNKLFSVCKAHKAKL